MAKYEKHLTGNFDEVLNAVTDGVLNGSMSASYEDGSDWTNGTVRCAVRVFERYSYMGGNRVSMNVTLVGNGRDLFLSAITSGGSTAVFFKLNTLGERVMFVFGNTAEMLQFCQGYKLDAINLGATANHDGADQVGGKDSSVFFDATQKADVNQLLDMGIKLYVQQTPTYQSVDIDAKL